MEMLKELPQNNLKKIKVKMMKQHSYNVIFLVKYLMTQRNNLIFFNLDTLILSNIEHILAKCNNIWSKMLLMYCDDNISNISFSSNDFYYQVVERNSEILSLVPCSSEINLTESLFENANSVKVYAIKGYPVCFIPKNIVQYIGLSEDLKIEAMNDFYLEFLPFIVSQSFQETALSLETFILPNEMQKNKNACSILRSMFESVEENCKLKDKNEAYCFKATDILINSININKFIENCHKVCNIVSSPDMLETYTQENPSAKLGGSYLREGVTLNKNVIINRSIIGRGCTIGQHSKILNSIISDNVIIPENITVNGCIVLRNANIEENKTFKQQILPGKGDAQVIWHN
ncbi:MAG: hypothetical protein MHMPM18_002157 [Marteilia pararefringens]